MARIMTASVMEMTLGEFVVKLSESRPCACGCALRAVHSLFFATEDCQYQWLFAAGYRSTPSQTDSVMTQRFVLESNSHLLYESVERYLDD